MDEIGARNRARFDDPVSVAAYDRDAGLTPCEAALFERHIEPGARVLDLGVGTGRTTSWLADRATTYVGIDCAPAMVAAARRRHPGADLREGDAADLGTIPDDSMDAVVFSYNGIDYLSDPDRRRALAEIRRVLAPAGVLVFSSHDPRGMVARLGPPGDPVARRIALATIGTLQRVRRLGPSQALRRGEGWILDPAKGGLLTHMATPARVAAELAEVGFEVIEQRPGDEPAPAGWWRTPWWYYACRPVPG